MLFLMPNQQCQSNWLKSESEIRKTTYGAVCENAGGNNTGDFSVAWQSYVLYHVLL